MLRLRSDARIELIRGVPLFEHCSRRDLARIAAIAEERSVPESTELTKEGDPARLFFVLLSGTVRVTRRGRTVGELAPATFFGEIALLSQSPRTATVTTTAPAELLVITSADFIALLEERPELWLKVARTLAERLEADEQTG